MPSIIERADHLQHDLSIYTYDRARVEITPDFLNALAEAIRDRVEGVYGSPSPIEAAALMQYGKNLATAIAKAAEDAKNCATRHHDDILTVLQLADMNFGKHRPDMHAIIEAECIARTARRWMANAVADRQSFNTESPGLLTWFPTMKRKMEAVFLHYGFNEAFARDMIATLLDQREDIGTQTPDE